VPQLGIVYYRDDRSFCMADIPGIIEGASEGKGLGHRFLRHIERNSVLLFMISATCESIKQEYDILINELKKYNPELLDKKRLIAISKSDLIDEEIENWYRSELKGVELIFISSIANKNLDKLKDKLWEMMTAED
jgi:GTP-binding protein